MPNDIKTIEAQIESLNDMIEKLKDEVRDRDSALLWLIQRVKEHTLTLNTTTHNVEALYSHSMLLENVIKQKGEIPPLPGMRLTDDSFN